MNDITILIVDDESRMRKLIKDFLIKKNYNILEAAEEEEALMKRIIEETEYEME